MSHLTGTAYPAQDNEVIAMDFANMSLFGANSIVSSESKTSRVRGLERGFWQLQRNTSVFLLLANW